MPVTLHHVALTVANLEAAVEWYGKLFDITVVLRQPHDGGRAALLADPEWRLVVALHEHDANDVAAFSERRTGLDHVGLGVATRRELIGWQQRLEQVGGVRPAAAADRPLTQSPIADTEYGSILVFRDPDNIQLELFAPPGA